MEYELNSAYPWNHGVRLHTDDAAVVPVCPGPLPETSSQISTDYSGHWGSSKQIGNKGLSTVIEFLPGQYTKRTLNSKTARANYVMTVLADPQRPFIWEFFCPGTIPLAGERVFYDEVCFTGSILNNG
jgi:hypothetical protein